MATGGGIACLLASRAVRCLAAEPRRLRRLTRAARADTSTTHACGRPIRCCWHAGNSELRVCAKIDAADQFSLDVFGGHLAPWSEASFETTRSSLWCAATYALREAEGSQGDPTRDRAARRECAR